MRKKLKEQNYWDDDEYGDDWYGDPNEDTDNGYFDEMVDDQYADKPDDNKIGGEKTPRKSETDSRERPTNKQFKLPFEEN